MKHTNNSRLKTFTVAVTVGLISLSNIGNAQVAVNDDNSDGDASSELHIQSLTKGVLFPVMTEAERDAIASPAAGLLVFNRSGGYHNYYDGSNWVQINRTVAQVATNGAGAGTDIGVGVGVADPDNSSILHVNSVTKGFLLPRYNVATSSPAEGLIFYNSSSNKVLYHDGTDWKELNSTTGTAGAGGAGTAEGVLIGEGTIEASAKMEVKTTANKGLLIPRMSTAQRDAILSPAEGLAIYNLTDHAVQYYSGATWYNWSNGASTYGTIITDPGQSCKDIYDANPSTQGVDGNYFIDPDGAGGNAAYECQCDMTRNGGGWTLVVNTGPKKTNTNNTSAYGATPVTSGQSNFAKLSDADIGLIRGTLATSIIWLERQNSCIATKSIFFKSPLAFSSSATGANRIETYHTTYANATSDLSLQTATSNYAYGIDSWGGGTAGYRIIYNYGTEGFITSGCNSTCGGVTNRSECNVLMWIKQP